MAQFGGANNVHKEDFTMMQHWIRFIHRDTVRFGTLNGDEILVHEGDIFSTPTPTNTTVALSDVRLLIPTQPTKVIALWNNFRALGQKLNLAIPPEPLYLIKAPNSYLDPNQTIRKPLSDVKVVFEGELGIVIGKTCSAVPEAQAMDHVFGFTCANDVTAADILNRDPSFAQWVRAKGLDTFCPLGPVIATGLDPATLVVKTILNGEVRQNYPVSDMLFSVEQLVSRISMDMTLNPGDIILCGTSVGVGSMKPGSTIEVEITGIGRLSNRYQ
jgi:2-keto-4-pentenoate hydratase/2-oxohepta-3-ene-1,7-dioic acid hydratase in catechol pathway